MDRYMSAKVFMMGIGEEEEGLCMIVLLAHRGSFMIVLLAHSGSFRMDFSENRWRLVHDLGCRSFFVAVAPKYFGAPVYPWPAAGSGRPACNR